MERKIYKSKQGSDREIQALTSTVVARANLASRLGQQYGGDRDLYQTLGYKLSPVYMDFLTQYTRQDMAKAIIDRPVKATWQGQLELVESQEADRTPFEQAWYDLNKKFKLRSLLSRVDRLTGIGRYGVLLLGLNDVKNSEGFANPVTPGKKRLVYIKPFSEESAKIESYVSNPKHPRYGMPAMYTIQVADPASGSSSTIRVHHSRVIHITDDNLESEIYGIPRLEAVFNRLMDIEKLVGGDAEMFWKGARPGYQGVVDKDFAMTDETKQDLKDQIDEFDHNLRRILINEGVDLKGLEQQIASPKDHFDVQLTCLAAVSGIPKRILSGSERGELASTQDSGEWKTFVQSRREDHAEPHIIEPVVDRFIKLGILPTPEKEWSVDWLDLFSVSEKERVEIGQKRSEALRAYTTNPIAQAVIPIDAWLDLFAGLSTQQIALVKKMITAGISADQKDLMEELDAIINPTPPVPVGRPVPVRQPPMSRTKSAVKKVA